MQTAFAQEKYCLKKVFELWKDLSTQGRIYNFLDFRSYITKSLKKYIVFPGRSQTFWVSIKTPLVAIPIYD